METKEIEEADKYLNSLPEGEPVADVNKLATEFNLVILMQAMEQNICPVRMRNRHMTPMTIANALVRKVQELLK